MQVRPNLYAISNVWWIIILPCCLRHLRPSGLTILRFQSCPPRNLLSSPDQTRPDLAGQKKTNESDLIWSPSRQSSHFGILLLYTALPLQGQRKWQNPSLKINILHLKLFAEISCMFWWYWQTYLKTPHVVMYYIYITWRVKNRWYCILNLIRKFSPVTQFSPVLDCRQ